jgi:hypothetical protein
LVREEEEDVGPFLHRPDRARGRRDREHDDQVVERMLAVREFSSGGQGLAPVEAPKNSL